MPREVFADEIERFLATLDGVSSARVLTGPAGDISFVYVTTDSAGDSRGLRGGVVAALQAHFGIPIDEWRVRITQLRAGAPPSEIPHFRIVRVEETAAGPDLSVTIKLQWRHGAEERNAVGKARARVFVSRGAAPGAAGRSRALAAAAIAAVRDALDVPHAELAVDRVGSVTFLDRPVILVALSAAVAGQTHTLVGAAFDEATPDPASEPAVTAALDAVTRWLVERAFAAESSGPQDRRDRLEAMRHFVLDAAADTAAPAPAEALPVSDESLVRESGHEASPAPEPMSVRETVESMRVPGPLPRVAPVRALPPRRAGMIRNGGGVPAAARVAAGPPPLEPAVRRHGNVEMEIVPELKGPQMKEGTVMGLQHDTPETGPRAPRSAGVEDAFYRSLVAERTPVHLRCRDGYEVPHAIVRDAGTYALLVETDEGLELFFKHAIISIRVLPKGTPQA
jgi:sRNA-binding regulator protein Hfq